MGSRLNLITTVIGFAMSATFIVFVCTRLICGRLRRSRSRQMFEISSTTRDLGQVEQQIDGLEPVVVAALPTMKLNREASASIEDAQCSICLGEYQEKEILRIMPKCGHNFHLYCVDTWLRKQPTCPICRLPQRDSLDPKLLMPTMVRMAHLVDCPESSVDHSSHWLLPGHELWVGHDIEQGLIDSPGTRNLERNAPNTESTV